MPTGHVWRGGHGAVVAAGAHANDRIVPCQSGLYDSRMSYRHMHGWLVLYFVPCRRVQCITVTGPA